MELGFQPRADFQTPILPPFCLTGCASICSVPWLGSRRQWVQGAGLGRSDKHRERNPSLLGLLAFLVSQPWHVTGRVESPACHRQGCHSPSTDPILGSSARPPMEPEGQCLGWCQSHRDIRKPLFPVPPDHVRPSAGTGGSWPSHFESEGCG